MTMMTTTTKSVFESVIHTGSLRVIDKTFFHYVEDKTNVHHLITYCFQCKSFKNQFTCPYFYLRARRRKITLQ